MEGVGAEAASPGEQGKAVLDDFTISRTVARAGEEVGMKAEVDLGVVSGIAFEDRRAVGKEDSKGTGKAPDEAQHIVQAVFRGPLLITSYIPGFFVSSKILERRAFAGFEETLRLRNYLMSFF